MQAMANEAMISPSLHICMIAFTLLIVVAIQAYGLAAKRNNQVEQVSCIFGYGMLVLYGIYLIYFLVPSNFNWGISLPLQVCDLLIPISAMALLSSQRDARALQYFCAFILAGQAIATPAGDQNPLSMRFWLYWLIHAGIYSSAIFDLLIRRYRPFAIDLFRVMLFSLAYVSFVFPLNVLFNWNYGFLGDSKPNAPTIIDFLGPWPKRVLLIVGIALIAQSLMLVPWSLYRLCSTKGIHRDT